MHGSIGLLLSVEWNGNDRLVCCSFVAAFDVFIRCGLLFRLC